MLDDNFTHVSSNKLNIFSSNDSLDIKNIKFYLLVFSLLNSSLTLCITSPNVLTIVFSVSSRFLDSVSIFQINNYYTVSWIFPNSLFISFTRLVIFFSLSSDSFSILALRLGKSIYLKFSLYIEIFFKNLNVFFIIFVWATKVLFHS